MHDARTPTDKLSTRTCTAVDKQDLSYGQRSFQNRRHNVAATALHWLDPASTIAKIGRAVRPGGWFAAWWTVFADPHHPPS